MQMPLFASANQQVCQSERINIERFITKVSAIA